MTVTDLFAVRTYAEVVYTRAAVGMEPGEAPLAALPGMIVIALLVAAGLVLCAKLAPRDRPAALQRPWVFKLGRLRIPATVFAAAMLLLLVAVPLGNLLYQAGVIVIQTDAGRVRSWSLEKCLAILADAPWRNRREFGWSLLIGPCAATAAVAAGVALAWSARRGGLRALAVLALTAACLAVPGPVLGLLVIVLLNRPNMPWLFNLYDHSILAPWLVLTLRAMPAATLILWHAFRTIPADVLESAALDGAGPIGRLWHIVVPLRLGGHRRGLAGGAGRGPGRPGRQHPRAAAGRGHHRHAPLRHVALRRRGSGGGDEPGPAGTVRRGRRDGKVAVDPLGWRAENRRMV